MKLGFRFLVETLCPLPEGVFVQCLIDISN